MDLVECRALVTMMEYFTLILSDVAQFYEGELLGKYIISNVWSHATFDG